MEKIRVEFSGEKWAGAARAVLQKSLCAVGSSRIKVGGSGGKVEVSVSDRAPSKEKAAHFGAKRLMNMLLQIGKSIK